MHKYTEFVWIFKTANWETYNIIDIWTIILL